MKKSCVYVRQGPWVCLCVCLRLDSTVVSIGLDGGGWLADLRKFTLRIFCRVHSLNQCSEFTLMSSKSSPKSKGWGRRKNGY